jgi:hypothetical protein
MSYNINTLWNMLDLAIGIYKADTTAITNCSNYWKDLIDDQIVSTNIVPPLKDSGDKDTTTTPSFPYSILPQEIDRCTPYVGTDGKDHFHSGTTQGIRGIHYSNLCLLGFVVTVRLLDNRVNITNTSQWEKLKNALATTAIFVLYPKASPYYSYLTTQGYDETDFYSPNETTYMRLAGKFFSIPNMASVFLSDNQKYDRYLFLPILQRKWLSIW